VSASCPLSGVFFRSRHGTTHSSAQDVVSGAAHPLRGSGWEFEFDANDVLHVRVDRRRKFLSTILLRALGYNSNEAILALFYGRTRCRSPSGRPAE